jgi:YVTN family beta-propeller protein
MRRGLFVIVGLAVLALAIRVGGTPLATLHVKTVTGRADVGEFRCWNCHGPKGALSFESSRRYPDPWFLATDPDSSSLYVTCGPIRKLARVDIDTGTVELSVDYPGLPRGVAISSDGSRVAVSLGEVDQVVLVDPQTLAVEAMIAVGTEPTGLTFNGPGDRLFVANTSSGDISVIDLTTFKETHRIPAGREPFAVALSPDGTTAAVVSRTMTVRHPDQVPYSELVLLNAADGTVASRLELDSTHLFEALTFTPDGQYLLLPGVKTRNLLPILQVARGWVMSSVLAVVDIASDRIVNVPLNQANITFPDPSGISIDANSGRVYVASGGSNQVAVLDLEKVLATAQETAPGAPERFADTQRYLIERIPVGKNPKGLAFASGRLAVAERLNNTLSLIDPVTHETAKIVVGPLVPIDSERRGDAVFHDASYAFQGAFSCRSCHPESHTDGLTYDFDIDGVGRNVVLNRSLRGLAGTAPFKWIGLNPTLNRQCGARFAMVLTRADVFPDDELEDLVAFLNSLPPPRADPTAGIIGGQQTPSIQNGSRIFSRDRRKNGDEIPLPERCSTCHSGRHYSNLQKADIGTRGPYDSHSEFDVPHLTGIGSKAPYLHDGRATTLEEIWTLPGVGDQHGVVSDLNKAELNDLVEFLKGL